jgi:aminoglycoside phosphotransferase (APT) family kinase protein
MLTIPTHLLMPQANHGAILVDAHGSLPLLSLDLKEEDTVVVGVRRALRSAWNLDAVVLETHLPPAPEGSSDDHVALAVIDAPDPRWTAPAGTRWDQSPRELPERVGPRAATWLGEWEAGAEPPPLRPRWARPGWHARAAAWIRAALEQAGRPAAGEIEMRRLWGISAIARIATADGGTAWFKAVFPPFKAEVTVTRFLEASTPDAVPHVIAAEGDAGWLLLDDLGAEPIGSAATDDQLAAAIRRLVQIQASMAGREDELRAVGVADRPLRRLADDVAVAMDDPAEIEGPDVAPERLATVVDWVRRQSDWLDAVGLPDTLVHGDFHVLNVMERDGEPVIIDWSDAAISHPLLEIGPWFGHPMTPGDPDRSWAAWLDALSALGPVGAVRGERERVLGLASAFQLVSYAAIVRGLEPANRYQLSDGVRDFWSLLDARVP